MIAIGGNRIFQRFAPKLGSPSSSTQLRASNRDNTLLRCMSPLLAQSGHPDALNQCPLSGAKRT
jgi:hypothetical protein